MLPWIQVLAGFIILVGSAEVLVKGASALAYRFGISPLVVGLTIVAYGTSAPELAVSLAAAWAGSPGIVIGNVIGSNIANLGLVLGVAALIRPLAAQHSLLKKEIPFLLLAAFLVPIGALGGLYSRWEGLLLLGAALSFSFYCFFQASQKSAAKTGTGRDDGRDDGEALCKTEEKPKPASLGRITLLIAAGAIGLTWGSNILVGGAVAIATLFGVSDHIIGLTLIALGTSLPELAACSVSAIRGHVDLVVGNVIGSNIFNVFFILGGTAAFQPIATSISPLSLDIVVMLLMSVILVPFIVTGARISRVEGALYLLGYLAFLFLAVPNA